MPQPLALQPWSEIAKRVKKVIDQRAIPQQVFADELGLDKGLVSRYLNGQHEPRFDRRMQFVKWCEKHSKN